MARNWSQIGTRISIVALSLMLVGQEAAVAEEPAQLSVNSNSLNNSQFLPVRLVVKRSQRRVYVYEGDKAIASYAIAVGKQGWETPIGDYQVFSKEANPTFKNFKTGAVIKPGPDNPLGVRWIGIWTDGKTQIGFHGTNQPELIGKAVSHGCIRMLNKDVVKLFEQVAIGTPVVVQP